MSKSKKKGTEAQRHAGTQQNQEKNSAKESVEIHTLCRVKRKQPQSVSSSV
jgi:hypothetical protein